LSITLPVFESSNLSNIYLMILKLDGINPEPPPECTPSLVTYTLIVPSIYPLRVDVIHKVL
jgi:hypothetical protein